MTSFLMIDPNLSLSLLL